MAEGKTDVVRQPDSPFGWIPVVGGFICFFWSWGGWYAWNGLFSVLQEEFHATKSDVAWISSLACAFLQFSSFLTGLLAQRFSARFVVGLGSVFLTLAYIGSSFATELWHLYLAFGVFGGAGSSMISVSCVSLVSQWFIKRRAFAIGWVSAGSGVGALALGPLFEALTRTYNWRACLQIIAGIIVPTMIAATLCMVRRVPVKRMKFEPKWMKDPVYINLAIALPFMFFGYWTYNVYIANYATTQLDMDPQDASLLISVFGIANTIGRIILSLWVDERVHPLIVYAVSLTARGIFTIFFPLVKTPIMYFVYTCLCSVFSAGGLMLPVVVAKYFPLSVVPVINGTVYAFAGIGSLVGSPSVGIMIDRYGWVSGAVTAGLSLAISGVMMLMIFYTAKLPRVTEADAQKPLLMPVEDTDPYKKVQADGPTVPLLPDPVRI
eukprot:GILK01002455.1.p1 GENE.GILK01002455.1~~GILK01002455.1.p1  ORF type:complete len:455 (+),score=41.26 GILK01002455.1:59-1366(+)